MRSRLNVDLAKGYDIVLVLVVAAGRFAEAIRRRAERETALLEAEAVEVTVIFPDEGSREAAGPNLMDASRRPAVARAGFGQGRLEAARLRPLWS